MHTSLIIEHAIETLGTRCFFEIVGVLGMVNLSKTCSTFRLLQLDQQVVTGAITGSTNDKRHLNARLSLFGLMPRAILHGSRQAVVLLQTAAAYERNLLSNRRRRFPNFYAYSYYHGVCRKERRRVWNDIATILCEMMIKGASMDLLGEDSYPWGAKSKRLRTINARHYTSFYQQPTPPVIESIYG
jgi:hypothetical protein